MDVSQTIETLCDQSKAALPREVGCSLSLAEEALALAHAHPVTVHSLTRAVVALLRSNSRTTDICVRYGGEELLLVMPDTTLEQGKVICERLRLAIEQHPWELLHPELAVTISIGLVGNPAPSVEQLLQRADKQLYAAKSRGKNQVAY